MSHAGKAHDLIEPIFGKDAKLVPAAGSGKIPFNLFLSLIVPNNWKSLPNVHQTVFDTVLCNLTTFCR